MMPIRYVETPSADRWELALSVVLRLGREKAASAYPHRPWASPFRVVGRRWLGLTESGGYAEVSREAIEVAVRRCLDRHFKLTREGAPAHLGVTRRMVAAVIAEIAEFPCVRAEEESP